MILPRLLQSFNVARSGVYFLESLPFSIVSRLMMNSKLPPPSNEQVLTLWRHILELHEREAENLERELYPIRALEMENPLHHMRSFLEVLRDGVRVAWRMRKGNIKEFSSHAENLSKSMPDYYARNFHFQTDGYLSEASARRYDHQVEILFSGTAGAMRRLILPVLKHHTRGQGHWLELGCGTGSATRSVLETFPTTKVTAMDLSAPYLKIAQEHLRRYSNVGFLQADVTDLDFKNDTFDAVYSVFMLHELPKAERESMLREAYRVLRPGGVMVVADSLQKGDEPELDWALERFPKIYHEPFYANYLGNDLGRVIKQITGCEPQEDHAFFTKVVWVHKPASSALS